MRKLISKKGRLNSSKSVFDTKNIADTLQTIWDEDPGTGYHSNAWYKKELEKRGCKVPADSKEFAKVLDEAWDLAEAGDRAQDADLDSGCHGKKKMNSSRREVEDILNAEDGRFMYKIVLRNGDEVVHEQVVHVNSYSEAERAGIYLRKKYGTEQWYIKDVKKMNSSRFNRGKLNSSTRRSSVDLNSAFGEDNLKKTIEKKDPDLLKSPRFVAWVKKALPYPKIQSPGDDAWKAFKKYFLPPAKEVLNKKYGEVSDDVYKLFAEAWANAGTMKGTSAYKKLAKIAEKDERVNPILEDLKDIIETAKYDSKRDLKGILKTAATLPTGLNSSRDGEETEETEDSTEVSEGSVTDAEGNEIVVEDLLIVQDPETREVSLFVPESEDEQVPENVDVVAEVVVADSETLDSSRHFTKFAKKLNCSEEVEEELEEKENQEEEKETEEKVYDEIELPSGEVVSVENILVVQDPESKELDLFIPESEDDQVPDSVEVIGESVPASDSTTLDSSRRMKKFQRGKTLNSSRKRKMNSSKRRKLNSSFFSRVQQALSGLDVELDDQSEEGSYGGSAAITAIGYGVGPKDYLSNPILLNEHYSDPDAVYVEDTGDLIPLDELKDYMVENYDIGMNSSRKRKMNSSKRRSRK